MSKYLWQINEEVITALNIFFIIKILTPDNYYLRGIRMNQITKPKKPFGLSLACQIAAEALQKAVAPSSVVLANLLILQQEAIFPKELDTHFFSFQKKMPNDMQKKTIGMLLGELKKPQQNVAETLEKFIGPQWVIKKSPPKPEQKKVMPKAKTTAKKKPVVASKPPIVPVVIVKKSKLNI